MSENFNKYFSTGEFAKLFGIHKKTLFHYDSIGLFSPDKIEANGYRYYSHKQIELFNVILQLKQLRMPLKEIKDFIDNRNEQMVIDLFTKEKNKINKEIQNLKRIEKLMDNKISLIKLGIDFSNEITLEEQEEEKLILSDYEKNTEDIFDIKNYAKHLKYCFENKLDIGYPVGCMINSKDILKGEFNKPDYYFTKVDCNSCEKIYVKPKGLYVTGFIKDNYVNTWKLYQKLLSYINDNNLYIEDYSYEQWIIDEIAAKSSENYVIKISIKVKYK